VIGGACTTPLPPEVVAAYDAPFPDDSYKAGARAFPALVPTRPDDPAAAANRAAWEVLARWDKPFLTAFSDGDPITRGGDRAFQHRVPGTQGLPHRTLSGGHFLQEDAGPELARAVVDLVAATPRH
jgi:haloalkane dehalogenase